MARTRSSVLAILILGLGLLLWSLTSENVAAPTDTTSESRGRFADSPSSGNGGDPSDVVMRSEAVVPVLETRGLARWEDGIPAAAVTIRYADMQVVTDEAGRFALPSEHAPTVGGTLPVLAPCWTREDSVSVQAAQREDGDAQFRLVLPNRFTIRFAAVLDPEVLAALKSQGRDRLVVGALRPNASPMEPGIGALELALQSTELQGELEIRTAPTDVRLTTSFAGGTKFGVDYFGQPLVVALTRSEVADARVSLGRDSCLWIRTVDHEGNPLSGCGIKITTDAKPLPIELAAGKVSSEGNYFHLGTAGQRVSIRATYRSSIVGTAEVTTGATDTVLVRIDLSRFVRLRVLRGGRACDAYECGVRPWLFGRNDDVPLANHFDGVSWIDPAAWTEPHFVCWLDHGSHREQRVALPAATDGKATLDLDSLPPPQNSRVEVRGWDGSRRLYVYLELLQPLDALPPGSRQDGMFAQASMTFLAVPWGQYRFEVSELAPRRTLAKRTIEVGRDPVVIDLTQFEELK